MTDAGPVAVIGGGFSGSALAIALLERGAAVVLIERSGAFGPGLAYGTSCGRHLLNVRSGRMSLRPGAPDHFVRWLAREKLPADPHGFARRADYGRYIQSCLEAAARQSPHRFAREAAEAVAVVADEAGAVVALKDGRRLRARQVVLATGNPPPGDLSLPGLAALAAYVGDPWAPGALEAVGPEQDVFLIGAGLTAVDVLLALEANGWRGRAVAVSRRGLLPRTHGPRSVEGEGPPPTGPLSEQLRAVRTEARRTPWTEVLDHMRPHHQPLWRDASETERRRFLRHLRPWWDVHRHRMAPEIGAHADHWTREGRLAVSSGRLTRVQNSGEGVVVIWRARGGVEVRTRAAWVVNCTGPQGDPSRVDSLLLRDLLARGAARVDPLRLGLDTDADGRIIDADGRPQPRLSALGPLTRGALWEIVAVPEIRQQAEAAAERLTASAGTAPRRPSGPLFAFTDHPREQGESYGEHMAVAFRFGLRLLAAGGAACVHGVAPFLFKKTASRAICEMHAELAATRRGPAPPPPAS